MHVWNRIGNNVVRLVTPASIDREAIRWVVRMDSGEPLTDLEKKTLREWASRSKLHRNALIRFRMFWSEADVLVVLEARPEYKVSSRARRSGAILLARGALTLASIILILSG